MRLGIITIAGFVALSACTTMGGQYSRGEAIEHCEEKMRLASGPTGEATIGANSRTGPHMGLSLNFPLTGLQGRTPEQYFNACMDNLAATGQITEGS